VPTIRSVTPCADFTRVDPRAVALLPERWARRHGVLPVAVEGGSLVVATSDPLDLEAERVVGFASGQRVRWAVAPAHVIAEQIDRWYGEGAGHERRREEEPPVAVEHLAFRAEPGAAGDAPASVVPLVDQLLADGIRAGASDIHLEPEEQGVAVRHRVDGVLRQVQTLPRTVAPSLVSRIKILSGLDIADRLRPQDGRARVAVAGVVVDLRVSTLPASHGEKVVVRVLDGRAGLRTLDAIGFADGDLTRIRALLEQRDGLVLVTGPTGSGKSTTLASLLDVVNHTREAHIVTIEDPIEYLHTHGTCVVNQREVGSDTEDFGIALRHVLRQDPDVILVGELRDLETTSVAVTAAETGHLVLATLHTQSAAQTIDRLIDIFPPHQQDQIRAQLANCLQGVVTQALVPTPDGNGRTVVCEIMIATPAIRNLVREGKVHQIPTFIQSSSDIGMISFDQHLALRFDQRQVSRGTALEVAHDPDEFLRIARLQG